jgi:hypothetical protein
MFPESTARLARMPDNLTDIYEQVVSTIWNPHHLTTPQASTACYGDSFTLLFFFFTGNVPFSVS